jgi:predicted esterase
LAVRAQAFVVCPQGSPVAGNVYGWASAAALKSSVERALVALQRRFGAHVAEGTPVYAGFSQGAILAAPLLLESATQFTSAVFAEGGYASLQNAAFARNYYQNGGRTVLIACGTRACFSRAGRARAVLEHAGLRVSVGGDAGAGHNLNERMQAALRDAFSELLRDDPRWQLGPRR